MLLVALVAVALIFDFLNGLHDAANSIATVVSTRVLSPNVAVVWAAFFNFIAFLFFGLHVAQTIGTGIISPNIVDGQVIFGALMGAIVWNLLNLVGRNPLVELACPDRGPHRRPMDGGRLDDRRHRHGGHHNRPSVDTGGLQHCLLYASPLRPEGSVTRRIYWPPRPIGTGPLGILGNVLWLVLAGWWLALAHVVTAILLAITIVGIPFAWAHLKLAGLALWPIGKTIVPA